MGIPKALGGVRKLVPGGELLLLSLVIWLHGETGDGISFKLLDNILTRIDLGVVLLDDRIDWALL